MNPTFRISNEFATVVVSVVATGHGWLLEITSEETVRHIRLDALELEAIAGISHRDLDEFVLRTTQAEYDLRQAAVERTVLNGNHCDEEKRRSDH